LGLGVDEIQLIGETTHYYVEQDETFHARGVPYHMGGGSNFGELRIGAVGSTPTLTIEPGITIKMQTDSANPGRVYVNTTGRTGRLIAVGTAAQPIVFTPDMPTPAAGAWTGIDFDSPIDPGNRLEFVRVEYAGGPGLAAGYGCPPPPGIAADDAAIRMFDVPPNEFITSTTISDSAKHGFLRGWTGAATDFLPTNTFINIAGCNQVEPKPLTGGCPASPSCPK